jgi:membrane-bound lytic murein transglycosylase B
MTRKLYVLFTLLLYLLVTPSLSRAQRQQDFNEWLAEFRKSAISAGISRETLDLTLPKVQFIPRVIELDKSQPEFRLTVEEYLNRIVTDVRVNKGREILEQNQDLLNSIYQNYGVQPSVLLALWGIETDFGRSIGAYSVIDAVATTDQSCEGSTGDSSFSAYCTPRDFHSVRVLRTSRPAKDELKFAGIAASMPQLFSFVHPFFER